MDDDNDNYFFGTLQIYWSKQNMILMYHVTSFGLELQKLNFQCNLKLNWNIVILPCDSDYK